MSVITPSNDGYVDWFKFLRILLDSKFFIGAAVVLAALIGFGCSQIMTPKYRASFYYAINFYSVGVQQICGNQRGCMAAESRHRFRQLMGSEWETIKRLGDRRRILSTSTESPLDAEKYKTQIERINVTLTNEAYVEAKNEIAIIQTELTNALLNTERAATNMLHARRLIQDIDSGQTFITVGAVKVVKSSPKVNLIVALSVVLGGLIGVFFALVRHFIKKRKKQLAEA